MRFLYFFPGVERLSPEILGRQPDLRAVFRDCSRPGDLAGAGRLSICSVAAGPGGERGLMASPNPPDRTGDPGCFYNPDRQAWEEAGGYWVGYWNGNLPGPEHLSREELVSGVDVELLDGKTWTAPTVRRPWNYPAVPSRLRLRKGLLEPEILPQWQDAWGLSGKVFDHIIAGAPANDLDLFHWTAASLGVNYRVSPVECSILGILGTETIRPVLYALIDTERLIQFLESPERQAALAEMGIAENESKKAEGVPEHIPGPDSGMPPVTNSSVG